MTKNTTDKLNIDFSFKKNNVDELFFNLGESPDGFKNKDVTKDIDRVQETIEANKHYFVPTKKSSDRAQYFRKSIKDANIK